MPSLGRNLREFARQHGVDKTIQFITESRQKSKTTLGAGISDRQLSLRELAEGFMGPNWSAKLERYNKGSRRFMESSEAVDASAFSAITGQILIDIVKEKYTSAEFIGDQLVTVMPVTNGNLGTQKIPWLSNVLNDSNIVEQAMPYPMTTFNAQYITLPEKK